MTQASEAWHALPGDMAYVSAPRRAEIPGSIWVIFVLDEEQAVRCKALTR
jgi:hypothetical protein